MRSDHHFHARRARSALGRCHRRRPLLLLAGARLGSLGEDQLGGGYLSSPVWERPFVRLDADTLLLPTPALIISFPFAIVERLMGSDAKLEKAYGRARTHYLEDDVERIVRRSLPSARVHAGVKWTEPDTGRIYEHDVVAVLGMQVLIFEVKSGRLSPAARRGARSGSGRTSRSCSSNPARRRRAKRRFSPASATMWIL